jgi:23S rRNA pseudouridine1911/1915/1917 synthase
MKHITVTISDISKRLDVFLSERTGITRSQVQRLIKDSYILVNNKKVNQGYRIKKDDAITIEKPEEKTDTLIPEPIPIRILFMDDYLAVIDKPAGMVVYPAAGHKRGTLLNALAYHSKKLASIGAPLRPGVVHRLDKDTSGIMVVALDDSAYYDLVEQFKKRTIQRKYTAIVSGYLKKDEGEISLDIGRSASDRKKMSTKTKRGKEAVTRWKVIKKLKNAALIEARLGTGRTHQIRVHFSAIGHPVLGDRIYGKKTFIEINKNKIYIPRQMLHAETLGFVHPISKEYLEFSSPVPNDMEECIKKLSVSS